MDINSCPYCKTHQVSRMYNYNPGITRNSRKGTPSVSLECDLVSWKGTTWFLEYVTRYPEKDTRFPDNVTSFPNYVSWFSAKSSILIFSLFWKPGHIFQETWYPSQELGHISRKLGHLIPSIHKAFHKLKNTQNIMPHFRKPGNIFGKPEKVQETGTSDGNWVSFWGNWYTFSAHQQWPL